MLYVSIFMILALVSDGNAKNRVVSITFEQYSSFLRSPFFLPRVFKTPSSWTRISVPKDLRSPLPSNLGTLRPPIFKISFNFSYELEANSPQLNFISSFPRNAFLIKGVQTYIFNSVSDIDCKRISFL